MASTSSSEGVKKPVMQEIAFSKSLGRRGYQHVVHCFIYSPCNEKILSKYQSRAAVLMQMRFDGHLGFAGGVVDQPLDSYNPSDLSDLNSAFSILVDALARELDEEMNMPRSRYPVSQEQFLMTHMDELNNSFLHFFALKLTLKQIREIERCALKSRDFGQEVLGLHRVPLYTMDDGYCGFPAFLNNNFIGAAKCQLKESLQRLNILRQDEIDAAVSASVQNRPHQPERVVLRRMSSVSPPVHRLMNQLELADCSVQENTVTEQRRVSADSEANIIDSSGAGAYNPSNTTAIEPSTTQPLSSPNESLIQFAESVDVDNICSSLNDSAKQ